MRMADESLVVANYNGDTEAAPQTKITMASDDGTEYQIYQGVMGRPGVDFPVHPNIPPTTFSCRNIKQSGYYADLETDCQVFHICDGGRKISFLCPNGTIFRQSHLICDWWFRVDCGKSVELYEESAEQLAADQKIYKERSDEREKRKKQIKLAHGEKDVYALDEPYVKSSQAPPVYRQNSGERKSERNSKRVMDANFSDMYPGRQGKTADETVGEFSGKLANVNDRRTTTQNIVHTTQQPIIFTPRYRTRTEPRQENFMQAASGGLVNSFHKTQQIFAVDKALFSTTALPKYSETTTTARPETEKQFFAESASFASHRGGRNFNDFLSANHLQSTFPTSNFPSSTFSSTTLRPQTTPYKVVVKGTSKSVELGSANADRTQRLKKTEERLKLIPFSSTSPAYKPTVPLVKSPATTPYPTTYTSSPSRVPVDDVYFTTTIPVIEQSTTFEPIKVNMSSNNPDVSIALQELNILKGVTEPSTTTKVFQDLRDGLSVPPSSGPGALRSFALYFAGPDDDARKGKDLPFVTQNILFIPIRKNFGRRVTNQPDLTMVVDQIVRDNANKTEPKIKTTVSPPSPITVNITESKTTTYISPAAPSVNSLPTSLTSQTKDSFNALFSKDAKNDTTPDSTESEIGTTAFESFTEQPVKINLALQGNDLFGSQSRGLVEPDPSLNNIDDKYARIAPDLRELAQVFTKALSAYLDDPEGFRRVLSEIRPTEPSLSPEGISASPIEYPSATQEEDEVLDFSDVTKAPSKRKGTTEIYQESTTEVLLETTTITNQSDASNLILPLSGLNVSETRYRVPDTDLTAPTYESLDQSQSSYYTPSPSLDSTTNAIAEEINKEFSLEETLPEIDSNEALDSYFPLTGSVDDQSRPRYGGFQNNSRGNYSPYGAELTTTAAPEDKVTTFNPRNRTSALFSRLKDEESVKNNTSAEILLGRQVNNLALPLAIRSGFTQNVAFESEKITPVDRTTTVTFPTTTRPEEFEANPEEINLELSPPFETEPPRGFLVTYSLVNGVYQTNKPQTTTDIPSTTTEAFTYTTERPTTQVEQTETYLPTTLSETFVKTTLPSTTTTEAIVPTTRKGKMGKSVERIMELQETLMFNTTNVSTKEKEFAREMVEETMDKMNMTDVTASTLTKMMELAARNETYRRLVLLLVNDKSGKNKTVEEARLSLLRALLTPVISQGRGRPATTTTTEGPFTRSRGSFRRGKLLNQNGERTRTTIIVRRVTTMSPEKTYRKTTMRPRVVKTTESPTTTSTTTSTTTTEKPSTVFGNLGLIRDTIQKSKVKEIKINSLDDAILDSDSRAIELLRSLYSLAARWG